MAFSPYSQIYAHPPLHPSFNDSHLLTPTPPLSFFLSTVVSSDAASQKATGTMALTHASFPLPALCFPYGNPLCVCVCVSGADSGTEGHRQSRITTQNNPVVNKRTKLNIKHLIFILNSLHFPGLSLDLTWHFSAAGPKWMKTQPWRHVTACVRTCLA